jgi:hypothetical protein
MIMTKLTAVALVCALVLAACATAPLYHPAASALAPGYSEQKLEANRYRVTFTGGDATPAGKVQDYALLRAAELTLSLGYDWFTVVGRSTVNQDTGYGPGYFGAFGPPCGLFGCRGGIYGGFWYDDFDNTRLSASVEIVMGKGTKPNDPSAYDARDVAKTIKAGMR